MHNFAILGAGGIGYYLADSLARYLAHTAKYDGCSLFIIDGDIVEDRNLDRQHGIESLGRNKADVLATQLQTTLGDKINVTAVREFLLPKTAGTPEHRAWLRNGITLFGCVDNNKTRVFAEAEICEFPDATLVMGGNSLYKGQAQFFTKKAGEDLRPKISEIAPEILEDGDVFPDEESCTEEAEHAPQLLFTNQMVAVSMLTLWYSQVEKPSQQRLNEVLVDVETSSAHQYNRPSFVTNGN